jgi:hypothetical protein
VQKKVDRRKKENFARGGLGTRTGPAGDQWLPVGHSP